MYRSGSRLQVRLVIPFGQSLLSAQLQKPHATGHFFCMIPLIAGGNTLHPCGVISVQPESSLQFDKLTVSEVLRMNL